MKSKRLFIVNTNIVLPHQVINGDIMIEGDRIAQISESGGSPALYNKNHTGFIDASGMYLIPGLIDIHSDAVEKEIQPRPNTLLPIKSSLLELEKKLCCCGITTMYHSVCLSDDWGVRNDDMVLEIIKSIRNINKVRPMISHKVHLRYEVTFIEGAAILERLIRENLIDYLSFMDHTPGQGQFKDPEMLKKYTAGTFGMTSEKADMFFENLKEKQNKIDWDRLRSIAQLAIENNINLASHDDDTREKIDSLISFKGTVSEFPINIETALYAKENGLFVCVGAPNLIRGGSHSNNMKAIDAIMGKAADVICSDYIPSCLLASAIKLTESGINLPDAIRMVTLNPAKAAGIGKLKGSIEVGKLADLVIFELHDGYPYIRKTITAGHVVYQSDFLKDDIEEREAISC